MSGQSPTSVPPLERLTVTIEEAAVLLSIGRTLAYEAARRGACRRSESDAESLSLSLNFEISSNRDQSRRSRHNPFRLRLKQRSDCISGILL